MNLEKYIHVYSNTIPFELCDQILNEYSTEDWKPGTVNNYNREKSRKCKVVLLSHEDTIQKNFHVRKNIDDNLYKIVHQSLDKYIKKETTLYQSRYFYNSSSNRRFLTISCRWE